MSIENDDGSKSHGNVARDHIFQVIRQNVSAHSNRSRNIGTASALRQRTRSIVNCRRHKSGDPFNNRSGNAHRYFGINGQRQMWAMLRDDVVTESNQRDPFQAIAPEVEAGLYLVPKVIEGE